MLTRNYAKNQDNSTFNVIEFESKRERIFNQTEHQYQLPKYEIDSEKKWCGCLYRVWKDTTLLGTFYQKSKKWVANPFYFDYQRLPFAQSLEDRFRSNELAIRHIINTYEGN